jgi:cytochrome b561
MAAISTSRYDPFARVLHWLIVALIVVQYALAWTMPAIHRGTQPVGLITWHLEIGTVIIAVMLVRIVWRLLRREPEVVETTPSMRLVARLTHGLLYALLIVQPVMGWINASSRGWHVTLFGVIPLPALSPTGSPLGHEMGDLHQVLAWGLLGLIGLHLAGALYHHFILRDGVLRRMA